MILLGSYLTFLANIQDFGLYLNPRRWHPNTAYFQALDYDWRNFHNPNSYVFDSECVYASVIRCMSQFGFGRWCLRLLEFVWAWYRGLLLFAKTPIANFHALSSSCFNLPIYFEIGAHIFILFSFFGRFWELTILRIFMFHPSYFINQ